MKRHELSYNGVIHFYPCVVWEEDEAVGSFFESEAPCFEPLSLFEVSLC